MKSSENVESVAEPPKLHFKRIEHALKQVVDVGIPLHVQLLRQQINNIDKYQNENKVLELRCEQINAAKSVKLLKADLFELEQLNCQVREEDGELFQRYIRDATKDVVEILSIFLDFHADILTPLPETESESTHAEAFPPLVCNFNEDRDESNNIPIAEDAQLQLQQVSDSRKKFEVVEFLQKELLEVNNLIKQFSNFVFRQKDGIDTIEANIVQTSENVSLGAQCLKKASDYKAATLPLAGAVIGAVVFGPVGAVAGFKIFGSLACMAGGGIIGYSAGSKLKKKQLLTNELEMKALTYPSKPLSRSLPDLSQEDLNEKDT